MLDEATKAEFIGMIDLWTLELLDIKAQIIKQGGLTRLDELRLNRIMKEIKEGREALAHGQSNA